MLKRLIALAIATVLLVSTFSAVTGQASYSFSLDKEQVNAYWNADGTLALDYVFVFSNDPGAHPIDFVDVGMPNSSFDQASITADVGGRPVSISSDYQGQGGSGFSVDMGAQTIQPGQRGSVHVQVGRVSQVLYDDSNDPGTYASADFSPTWFGSSYVHGATDLTVIFHLPPGVQPAEPRYHTLTWPGDGTPQSGYDSQNRITYTWHASNASGSTQYTFGASFPQKYIPPDAIVTAPAFDPITAIASVFTCLGGLSFPVCFVAFFIGIMILSAVGSSRRKLEYLPPKIQIEGHGIKRGLTAVEAAILMETPLDKVLTMILFGLVKKGAAQVLSREPLQIQALKPPADVTLYDYETGFLAAFDPANSAVRKFKLQDMLVALVKTVSEKMKGFSRSETLDYYKGIMETAWQQIETAGTPEVQSQMFDEQMEWTMLDRDYDGRTRRVFTGPVFVPMWWGHYDPAFRPAGAAPVVGAPASIPTASGGRVSLPGANLAASMVGGVQNFAGQVVGDVGAFTAGVTNRTNPVPVSTGGSYHGGGGHCACACACAGCACACAGGGR